MSSTQSIRLSRLDTTHGVGSAHNDRLHVYGCTPILSLSNGWKRYVHINGGVYYHHAERGIITERDVSEESDQEAVLEDWEEFVEISRDNGMINFVTPDTDVVLRYLPCEAGSDEDVEEALEVAEAFFVCYTDASEVKCPHGDIGEL